MPKPEVYLDGFVWVRYAFNVPTTDTVWTAEAFDTTAEELAEKLYANGELTDMPDDHEFEDVRYVTADGRDI